MFGGNLDRLEEASARFLILYFKGKRLSAGGRKLPNQINILRSLNQALSPLAHESKSVQSLLRSANRIEHGFLMD